MVETVSGVIDTASFLAKEDLNIQHLESYHALDQEWLIVILHRSRDRVQMASMANALNEMAGFGMVYAASRAVTVHAGIRHILLQMAKVVLGQTDLGQMERLITEIPVTAEALFSGQLTNVIVEQAKRAKDWGKFCKAAENSGLKIITVFSNSEG